MNTQYYAPKVSWNVYAIFPIFIGLVIALILKDTIEWPAIILLILFSIFIYTLIVTTKYAIRGNELGVKCLYRWKWYPIEKIESITEITNYLSTPTSLSPHRLAIRFSDRTTLRSYTPLEISPKRKDEFISELLKINPGIKINTKTM